MSLLAPILNAVQTLASRLTAARAGYLDLLQYYTQARATKLDNLNATVSSRASADTALSNTTWTAGRAAAIDNLDAAVSSRAAASTALSTAQWTNTRAGKLDNLDSLDAAITTRASGTIYNQALADKIANLDVLLSSRMPGINRIGRGTISLSSTSATASLSPAVDPEKTLLFHLGASSGSSSSGDLNIRLTLTSETVITATRGSAGATAVVSYQFIEFN